MRIYQLAEEVRISNRVLVQLLQDSGVDISSHMSPLTPEEEDLLRNNVLEIRGEAPAEPAEAAPAEAPAFGPEEPVTPVMVVSPETEPAPEAPAGVSASAETLPPPTAEAPPTPVEAVPPPKGPEPPAPARPAGRKVRKIQEREAIEQGLVELEDTKQPVEEAPKVPERKVPEHARTFRFHKRGGPRGRTTLRRKSRGPQPPTIPTGPVEVTLPISVKDFSQALGVKVADILRALLENGVKTNINARLDKDTVDILALEFDREVVARRQVAAEEAFLTDLEEEEDRPEDLHPRAPVVALLGHVDHGKTSLLDYIRKTEVAAKEAGGITQHISSYKIRSSAGQEIVFIDLPGHEAFTEMRGRGAQATDIVILVVAAEEGVMPQTEECINHAKAAEVPVIVALNKCDRPEANPQRVRQSLSSFGLVPEEWGGDTLMVETSAVTGDGIPNLLDSILLQAEMLELKANPHKKARGIVLEAEKSEGRGVLATVLVQEGTLRAGDVALAGVGFGRIRDIRDDQGRSIEMCGPSTPVEVSGLSQVPNAGDRFYVVENLSRAKAVAEERARKVRESSLAEKQTLSLADLFRKADATETIEVPIIVKADTKGSVEAICEKLEGMGTEEVKIRIIHRAVGSVNESDVQLASASRAIILGFAVMAEDRARALAHERGVEINFYQIIYNLVDDVKQAMESELAPEEHELVIGHAEVRAVFQASRMGNVAGCYVTDGLIRRNSRIRLLRADRVVRDKCRIDSLRRFKDDVREVREGFECGIKLAGHEDVKEGDVIEAFEIEKIKRTLEDSAAREE